MGAAVGKDLLSQIAAARDLGPTPLDSDAFVAMAPEISSIVVINSTLAPNGR
jgi:hypothetical protein